MPDEMTREAVEHMDRITSRFRELLREKTLEVAETASVATLEDAVVATWQLFGSHGGDAERTLKDLDP